MCSSGEEPLCVYGDYFAMSNAKFRLKLPDDMVCLESYLFKPVPYQSFIEFSEVGTLLLNEILLWKDKIKITCWIS